MFTYVLLLITFILFPAAAFELSKIEKLKVGYKVLFAIGGFFLLHNFCFFFGVSLIDDYIDYIIFGLEYFFVSYIISITSRKKNIALKCLGIVGLCVMGIGIIIGFFGILIFIIIAQDFETDKTYNSKSAGKTYQTRRYSSGFATSDYIRYSYDTYRTFAFFPIEYHIDSTSFLDTETKLEPNNDKFGVAVIADKIIFSSEKTKLSKKLN